MTANCTAVRFRPTTAPSIYSTHVPSDAWAGRNAWQKPNVPQSRARVVQIVQQVSKHLAVDFYLPRIGPPGNQRALLVQSSVNQMRDVTQHTNTALHLSRSNRSFCSHAAGTIIFAKTGLQYCRPPAAQLLRNIYFTRIYSLIISVKLRLQQPPLNSYGRQNFASRR